MHKSTFPCCLRLRGACAMEVAAGLQVACNLIEIIKTTRDVITIGQLIRKGGAVSHSLLQEAQNLRRTSERLQLTLQPVSSTSDPGELALISQCQALSKCASEFEIEAGKYSKSQSVKKSSIWTSWKQSSRYVISGRDKLAELSAQLQRHEQHLSMQVNLRLSQHSDELRLDHKTSSAQIDLVLSKVSEIQIDLKNNRNQRTHRTRDIEDRMLLRKVLTSLHFQQMQSRKDSIQTAYHQTFEWALIHHNDSLSWDCLPSWISNTSCRAYWVCGKPGVGKSTFMRFIETHDLLQTLLASVQPGRTFGVVSYYFWRAGMSLQASRVGALRTLCHGIISQHTGCATTVFGPHFEEDDWTYQRLCKTFKRLVEATTCSWLIFIDALDECLDDREDLDGFLVFLESVEKCRVIYSSRPEQRFESRFAQTKSLRLQDLTRKDIEMYLQGRLHGPLESANHIDEVRKDMILQALADRAEGVFLWARLATTSMTERLEALETFEEIIASMDEMPADLDDMFAAMMDRLPDRYRKEAHVYFHLLIAAKDAGMQISLLQTATADLLCQHLRGPPRRSLRLADLKEHKINVTTFLRIRCAGLLEVRKHEEHEPRRGYYVDFIHRSAYDYVIGRADNHHQNVVDFNPYELLIRTQIQLLEYAEVDVEAAATVELYRIPQTFERLRGEPLVSLRSLRKDLDEAGQAFMDRRNLLTDCWHDPAVWINELRAPADEVVTHCCRRQQSDRTDSFRSSPVNQTPLRSVKKSSAEHILPSGAWSGLIISLEGYLSSLGFVELIRDILPGCDTNESTYLALCCVHMWRRLLLDGENFVPGQSLRMLSVLLERGVDTSLSTEDVISHKAPECNQIWSSPSHTLFSMVADTIILLSQDKSDDPDAWEQTDHGLGLMTVVDECTSMLAILCLHGAYDNLGRRVVNLPLEKITGIQQHLETRLQVFVNLTAYACMLASNDQIWERLANICWTQDPNVVVKFYNLTSAHGVADSGAGEQLCLPSRTCSPEPIEGLVTLVNLSGSPHCPFQPKDGARIDLRERIKESYSDEKLERTRSAGKWSSSNTFWSGLVVSSVLTPWLTTRSYKMSTHAGFYEH
ncbi:hypothetical protein BDZ85DRAFT_310138 [Elsinoe ampelina]|uniref:Uncharacterized protein n=1 Tax=Elsinoe ampelina TaxID=302913 RepID=A0A6A6GEK2_9PEZI|nr:hypothetical protein BDZ85DRAFT_310138 [Elsinoe ampelina]